MDVDSIDKKLLAKSLNYHGQQLQKIFERDFQDFNGLKIDNLLNFNEYTRRQKKFSFHDRSKRYRLQQFICKHANKIFNKNVKLGDVSDRNRMMDSGYFPVLPPFEWFLPIDMELRTRRFFESVKEGDIIGATVLTKTSAGIILKVLYAECGEVRCVSDIRIKAFCPNASLLPVEKKGSVYMIKDNVCCEILEVNADTEKVICGMKGELCRPENRSRLGPLQSDKFPPAYKKFEDKEKKPYHQLLEKSESFCNPDFVNNLMNHLGIPNELYSHYSYLKDPFPINEYAAELRIQQAAKWSLRSVAEGIEHFKAQRSTEAFQCLNKALTIDPRNIEALVARGALYANSASYAKAIADFEAALKLNPNHQNAKKYLGDTLIALGRSYEEKDNLPEAIKSYEECLKLIPNHEDARNSLQFVKYKLAGGTKPKLVVEDASSKKMQKIEETLSQLLTQTDEKHLLRELKKLKKKRVASSSSSVSSDSSSESSDESNSTSSSSDSPKKKKKSSKKERSLSPLSKRMVQMEGSTGLQALTLKSPTNEDDYENRVKTFLQETKKDDDYEEKVRLFLEETEKWKKRNEPKKDKSKRKDKIKSKKRKKESRKKKKKKEKRHKKHYSRSSSTQAEAITNKYLHDDFEDLDSKLQDYYLRVEEAANNAEPRTSSSSYDQLNGSNQSFAAKLEDDQHRLSNSCNNLEAESFEENANEEIAVGHLDTSIKFKMQMPSTQNKVQKNITNENPLWEEEKHYSEGEIEKEDKTPEEVADLEQIQLPPPLPFRPVDITGHLDKLRGFHVRRLDSPALKRGRSRSRSHSRDRHGRYRSRSSSRRKYR